jgi:hypothetical protein
MKKVILLLSLVSFLSAHSQDTQTTISKKNEIKGNALFLVLGAGEITYERLINEDSALGVSMFFVKENDFDIAFSLTPYYRAYFGKKIASGFFVEGFGMFNTGTNGSYSQYDQVNENYYNVEGEKFSDLALGFGLGSKWVHKRGFIFEINAGIGRNLFSSNSPEVLGRGGVTLGYRF